MHTEAVKRQGLLQDVSRKVITWEIVGTGEILPEVRFIILFSNEKYEFKLKQLERMLL